MSAAPREAKGHDSRKALALPAGFGTVARCPDRARRRRRRGRRLPHRGDLLDRHRDHRRDHLEDRRSRHASVRLGPPLVRAAADRAVRAGDDRRAPARRAAGDGGDRRGRDRGAADRAGRRPARRPQDRRRSASSTTTRARTRRPATTSRRSAACCCCSRAAGCCCSARGRRGGASDEARRAVFPTDETLAPQEVARLAEERGFESLWFPEHTHIPASRATPYPAGGDLPSMYWRSLDPFVALTAAAMATTELRLGTGICLVIERDPIVTAKEVASLDLLSGGRVEFGVGAGWNREEMRNHGTDPRGAWRSWPSASRRSRRSAAQGRRGHGTRRPTKRGSRTAPAGLGRRQRADGRGVLAFGDGWMPNVIDDGELSPSASAVRASSWAGRAGRNGRPDGTAVATAGATRSAYQR